MVPLSRRQRSFTILAAAMAVLAAVFIAARWMNPALATSGGDPYVVPLVTDTNPDPNIVDTTITAEPASVDLGNGITASALTFNGSLPGPEFRLKVGDTVHVHFVNNLGHPSGIHWHGIELSNPNDGTPLTQNMVPTGGTFDYTFKVSRPGIYWYHPHHHSSTNQVFKGLYGSIIVTDPNEAPLQASGALPSAAQTRTVVLSDATVCKSTYASGELTYDPTLPYVGGGTLPPQTPTPQDICQVTPVDEDGNPTAPFAAGVIPNIQTLTPGGIAIVEGNIVLTNGKNVGGRGGSPAAPGALAVGASTLDVQPGQGLRLQLLNTATTRFFRLRLTDEAGTLIPIVRVGGQGGLLDTAHVEGGVVSGFDFKYDLGQILLDPGDRADVVIAIPAAATGTLTMWTEDFFRTGGGFSHIPTVPVMHLNVTGAVVDPAYAIAEGTQLRAATAQPVEALNAATGVLLDPSTFVPAELGTNNQTIVLSNQISGKLGINGVIGVHDFVGDFADFPHAGSSRYASLGDTLELSVENATGAHHPFHLHGFSLQPLSLTKTDGLGPDYTFVYKEFRDNIDVPPAYTLHFRVRLDDRKMSDGVTPGGGIGRWVFHCHIFFHATFGMISELVVLSGPNSPPVLTVPGAQTADYHDALTFDISATDPDGDPITLSSAGLPAGLTLVDNGNGTGTVSGTITATPGDYLVTFSASDGINPAVTGDVTITVTREETSLGYTGPTVILNGKNAVMSAVLKEELDASGPAIAGRTVAFTLGTQSCSAVTAATGMAQCTIAVNAAALGTSISITATFLGDTFYLPSSATATATVFAFPARGAFVLGNLSAAAGGTQTWWSNIWSTVNRLSGGASPLSFKGFADQVTLPTSTPPSACGSSWVSSGGTSPPPATAVPPYMGVLVSSNVKKNGTRITGNTVRIVVVKVNAGYSPNAGSPGTGTIVAEYCH